MASQNQQLITTIPDGKLRDFIDRTIRNDTLEEHVRQNIVPLLTSPHQPVADKTWRRLCARWKNKI